MASSRDAILAAVRTAVVPAAPHPGRFQNGIEYPDPVAQLGTALGSIGGRLLEARDEAHARAQLADSPLLIEGRRICSAFPEIVTPTFALEDVGDPHDLEDLWLAVLPGEFAVAENSSVWITGRKLRHRAALFITQHLMVVVPRDQVLHNMHQAYDRLRFESPEFGLFLSGPSKTADIEQSLVIGAHGSRSLVVILLG